MAPQASASAPCLVPDTCPPCLPVPVFSVSLEVRPRGRAQSLVMEKAVQRAGEDLWSLYRGDSSPEG